MESIEERALSYARMADCRDMREMELAKFDYIAGAKEERILVVEWLERNAPQVVARFKADWERLSDEDKALWTFDKCERCEGLGTIEVEPYEPDYDDYND